MSNSLARLSKMYRSVMFQIVIVGLISFTQPGIWTALNNLGAGGQAQPYLINTANALTYGIMSVGCILAGGLCNVIGTKWTLMIGVVFYTPYASSLYCNNRFGTEWYVLFGAALCGIGASMFWASEAAIGVGYPGEAERGRSVAIWLALRNLGPLIGGAISLSLNMNGTKAGRVSYTTYLALIGIQCLGLPLTFLLSAPSKVVRKDGTPIPYMKRGDTTFPKELKAIWKALCAPHMLLLIPVFITGIWGVTYQSNYLTTYFSVRSRALASLLTAIANFAADFLIGVLTDTKRLGSQARRARIIWAGIALSTTGLWAWQVATQVHFTRHSTAVDWAGSTPSFNNAIAVYILWKFVYEAQLVYLYWLVGTYPTADGTMPRIMGILRTFESVGSAFSYGVGATHWPLLNQCILCVAFWVVCLVPATVAILRVPVEMIESTKNGIPQVESTLDDRQETSSSSSEKTSVLEKDL
ncbi:hypothetical protein CBS101457_004915 [Exobasidium rhododendri]|nr:hypothetical protein CBS101457_004915 [Exobasidium rhododendri]